MFALAYAALWLFIFAVPWENIIIIPGFGVISRVVGALALGITLMAVAAAGRFRRWHLFHVAAFLFVMWAALEQFLFHAGQRLPLKFWTYVQLLAVAWMVWELATSRRRQLGLFLAYVIGASVAATDTILDYHRKAGTAHRFAAEGFNTNDLAMILALAIPMAWYLGMTLRRPLARWICRAYLPLGLFALALTGSRGGMLAGIVGLLVVPFSMSKLTPGQLAAGFVVISASGVIAVKYVPEVAVARLASTGAEVEGGSFGGRMKIWKAGWQAFLRKPVMGYGTSGFIGAVTPTLGAQALVAHNSFLSVLVEQGLGGFAFYVTMLIAVLLAVRDLPRFDRRFGLVLLATLMVAILPLSWEDNKSTWIILAILLGFAQVHVDWAGAAGAFPERSRIPGPVQPRWRSGRPAGRPNAEQPR